MQAKLYKFATLWLTLSVLYFLVEYATEWLEVVTLGGLVAGAFIEGVFVWLGLLLARCLAAKELFAAPLAELGQRPWELAKALIVTAAFALEGTLTIVRCLPGYTLNFTIPHGIFLLVLYPALAVVLAKLVQRREAENGD